MVIINVIQLGGGGGGGGVRGFDSSPSPEKLSHRTSVYKQWGGGVSTTAPSLVTQ